MAFRLFAPQLQLHAPSPLSALQPDAAACRPSHCAVYHADTLSGVSTSSFGHQVSSTALLQSGLCLHRCRAHSNLKINTAIQKGQLLVRSAEANVGQPTAVEIDVLLRLLEEHVSASAATRFWNQALCVVFLIWVSGFLVVVSAQSNSITAEVVLTVDE